MRDWKLESTFCSDLANKSKMISFAVKLEVKEERIRVERQRRCNKTNKPTKQFFLLFSNNQIPIYEKQATHYSTIHFFGSGTQSIQVGFSKITPFFNCKSVGQSAKSTCSDFYEHPLESSLFMTMIHALTFNNLT